MNKRKEVLELLKKEELSAKEISEKTGYSIEIIRVYLNQFVKEKKAIIIGSTKGWHKKYRSIEDPVEFLKWLYNHMFENMRTKDEYDIREDLEAQNKLLLIEQVIK